MIDLGRADRFTPSQALALTVATVINMLDGFDVLATALAAPSIASEWHLEPAGLGALFSAGLVGMVLGSLLLSPLADIFGRRHLVAGCLALVALSMTACGFVPDTLGLAACRLATGLGVGGILSAVNTAVAEQAPAGRRDFAVAIFTTGYPLGAAVGGFLSILLLEFLGWRAIFLAGGVASAAMILPAWLTLAGRPIASRAEGTRAADLAAIFKPPLLRSTVRICVVYFLQMFTMYFVLNWTPRLLDTSGFTRSASLSGSAFMNLGGIVAGVSVALLARRFSVRAMATGLLAAFFLSSVAIALAPRVALGMLTITFVMGLAMFGAMTCLYAILPGQFPTKVRSTGTGAAIGFGRIGAAISPLLAGSLLENGFSREHCYVLLATPLLLAVYILHQLPNKREDV